MKPVDLIFVGAGSRGSRYAEYAESHPDKARIIGVAEPRQWQREQLAAKHNIDERYVFKDWADMAEEPCFADAAIITTLDAMHRAPAVALAGKGYHMLLEKPMAPDESGCREIVRAVLDAGVIFGVGHVMRYTSYTVKLKNLLDSGVIGEIVSIQHLESVGYWHQAHSFVRGNWRNEAQSSPMLLSKSCHDMDWIRFIVGRRCLKASSFGGLRHFRAEEKPERAAERCLDCPVEHDCPYSAIKIYIGRVRSGHTEWPVDVLTNQLTEEGVRKALETGPYGRCVYSCDNDVVDHQVVNLWFDGGCTVSFTMTAFTEARHRQTRIFGTRGEIAGDGSMIDVFDFKTDKHTSIDTQASDASILGGHGGGDYGLMKAFVESVVSGDASNIRSGPEESLESHLMVFAAEKSRKEGTVVDVK